MKRLILGILLICILTLNACTKPAPEVPTLTVMTHDSFSISEEVVKSFEDQNNVTLVFLKSGDTGAALNRAILTKDAPQADVFYGVDNTYLSRAIAEGIFVEYRSDLLSQVPPAFVSGTNDLVIPVDYGDVCINYDKSYFSGKQLPLPESLEDLLDPQFGKTPTNEPLLVVENPATSSPGLAFLLATIAEFGEEGYLDYWQGLRENGVVIVNDWETAYYTNFSASSGKGLQPMVVSYATSPAAEVIYASVPLESAPTASFTGENMCFRQVEYAGILRGSRNVDLARKFIDFMLSSEFQADIPLQMFMYPVIPTTPVPEEFTLYASQAKNPAQLDPDLIAARRDAWIQAWTEVMLP